jgi:hypothetical protein
MFSSQLEGQIVVPEQHAGGFATAPRRQLSLHRFFSVNRLVRHKPSGGSGADIEAMIRRNYLLRRRGRPRGRRGLSCGGVSSLDRKKLYILPGSSSMFSSPPKRFTPSASVKWSTV